jgi:hypothetical protein
MRASDYISLLAVMISVVMISVVAGWKASRVSAKSHETASFRSGTDLLGSLGFREARAGRRGAQAGTAPLKRNGFTGIDAHVLAAPRPEDVDTLTFRAGTPG